MLAVGGSALPVVYLNTAPSLTPGVSVVPGASNVEGDWTEIASAANIASDIYGVYLIVHSGAQAGQDKSHLLDLGVDPAGSTSYVEVVSNLVCGNSMGFPGRQYYFPLWIKSGSSVAVRIQGSNATPGTVFIVAYFYGLVSRPEFAKAGQYCETIGTITNSSGVTFTPGTTGAEGDWTLLGATTRNLWWFQLGVQVSSASLNSRVTTIDLAFGDASNKHLIISDLIVLQTTAELNSHTVALDGFREVPGGTNLYVRGSDSGGPNGGWSAVAVGIGG